jgi:hypothetical protein
METERVELAQIRAVAGSSVNSVEHLDLLPPCPLSPHSSPVAIQDLNYSSCTIPKFVTYCCFNTRVVFCKLLLMQAGMGSMDWIHLVHDRGQ